MNKNIILTVFAFSLLLVASSFAIAASPEVKFNSPIDGEEYEEEVDYDVYVVFPSEYVVAYEVGLYNNENDEFLAGDSGAYKNQTQGNFLLESDGEYYLYALFALDDGSIVSEKVYIQVNFSINNPLKILGYANPTPQNGALINSHNIDSAKIVAVANKDPTSFLVYLYNESDIFEFDAQSERQTDFSFADHWSHMFYDGIYTFYTVANVTDAMSEESVERTIRIKATVPNATYENSSFPESVNEDTSFLVSLFNVSVSEENVTLTIDAYNNDNSESLSSIRLDSLGSDELLFSATVSEPGIYNISLRISDDFGNSNTYELGELTVNDVAEVTEPQRRGGRGSSNTAVNNSTTEETGEFPLFRVDLEQTESNETQEEETEETEPGFFSAITGAVTGAFSTPPRAILTFIIIIVIIYAIVKIRGYLATNDSSEKPKKNGKKAKKEESSESSE